MKVSLDEEAIHILYEVIDYFEDLEDIVDDDVGPKPNTEMKLKMLLEQLVSSNTQ